MSGGSDKAAKQAQANQDQRDAGIQSATAQINQIFDNPARTGQYAKLGADTTAYYTSDLDKQKAINDRQMRFALARNGQTGSSVQTDQTALSGQDYLKGVLQAQQQGMKASAGLQSQDESSRANLIAQAQGGLNATAAAQNSAGALKANLAGASAGNTTDALGDVFGSFADIYKRSQDAAALRSGQLNGYGAMYQPGFGYAGGGTGGRP